MKNIKLADVNKMAFMKFQSDFGGRTQYAPDQEKINYRELEGDYKKEHATEIQSGIGNLDHLSSDNIRIVAESLEVSQSAALLNYTLYDPQNVKHVIDMLGVKEDVNALMTLSVLNADKDGIAKARLVSQPNELSYGYIDARVELAEGQLFNIHQSGVKGEYSNTFVVDNGELNFIGGAWAPHKDREMCEKYMDEYVPYLKGQMSLEDLVEFSKKPISVNEFDGISEKSGGEIHKILVEKAILTEDGRPLGNFDTYKKGLETGVLSIGLTPEESAQVVNILSKYGSEVKTTEYTPEVIRSLNKGDDYKEFLEYALKPEMTAEAAKAMAQDYLNRPQLTGKDEYRAVMNKIAEFTEEIAGGKESFDKNVKQMIKEGLGYETKEFPAVNYFFNAKSAFDEGAPYAAYLVIDKQSSYKKLDRNFIELDKNIFEGNHKVKGNISIKDGQCVEMRFGGKNENKQRSIYINHQGNLYQLGNISNKDMMGWVKTYLDGAIPADSLINKVAAKEVAPPEKPDLKMKDNSFRYHFHDFTESFMASTDGIMKRFGVEKPQVSIITADKEGNFKETLLNLKSNPGEKDSKVEFDVHGSMKLNLGTVIKVTGYQDQYYGAINELGKVHYIPMHERIDKIMGEEGKISYEKLTNERTQTAIKDYFAKKIDLNELCNIGLEENKDGKTVTTMKRVDIENIYVEKFNNRSISVDKDKSKILSKWDLESVCKNYPKLKYAVEKQETNMLMSVKVDSSDPSKVSVFLYDDKKMWNYKVGNVNLAVKNEGYTIVCKDTCKLNLIDKVKEKDLIASLPVPAPKDKSSVKEQMNMIHKKLPKEIQQASGRDK